jgi:hypothetical protein
LATDSAFEIIEMLVRIWDVFEEVAAYKDISEGYPG